MYWYILNDIYWVSRNIDTYWMIYTELVVILCIYTDCVLRYSKSLIITRCVYTDCMLIYWITVRDYNTVFIKRGIVWIFVFLLLTPPPPPHPHTRAPPSPLRTHAPFSMYSFATDTRSWCRIRFSLLHRVGRRLVAKSLVEVSIMFVIRV